MPLNKVAFEVWTKVGELSPANAPIPEEPKEIRSTPTKDACVVNVRNEAKPNVSNVFFILFLVLFLYCFGILVYDYYRVIKKYKAETERRMRSQKLIHA